MTLFKKAVRSMWDNKKAYIACIVLIVIGVFMYEVMGIAANVFSVARDKYYEEYRLGDVFAKVRAMPASAVSDLERLDGVDEAAGRYVYNARVLMPGTDKIITLRLTSQPPSYGGERPLNDIIVTGSGFNQPTDIMVGAAFLEAHGLKIGDSIRVIIERKEYDLTVCAVADSPEYVYAIKDSTDILPDPQSFGYGYIAQDSLWAFVSQRGVYNDVSIDLAEGVTYDDVKTALEDILKKYGLIAMFPQKDQASVAMVNMELDTITSMSTVMPFVFMAMAVVVLYLMLKRLIEQERTQIGVMKAFGYSNTAILFHYVLYGLVTGAIGGAMGCIYGILVSGPYIDMFKEYFNLPTENAGIPVFLVIRGFSIAVAAGALGGFFGARRAIKLNPADAMRPEAPKSAKSDFLKNVPLLRMMLTSGGSMAVRSITRNKMRSAVIVVGIVFSFGLLGFMGSYNTMIDFMMLNQFSKVQRYDAKLIFKNPLEFGTAAESAYRIEGVTLAEGILEMPVELKNRNLKSGVSMIGMESGSSLYAIYDNETGYVYPPPTDGILINTGLADKLAVRKGGTIYLSSPMLDDDVKVSVTDIVDQSLGMTAYMEIGAMSDLFQINKTATSVIVKTDDMPVLKNIMDEAKNLASVEDKATTLKNYIGFMEPYSSLIYIMWIMAVVVAFAIIYNTSTISLSERKREYATLRVIGLQVKEVAAIMGFEYWILCVIGMLLGIPFNMFLKEALASAFVSDAFAFPTFTPLSAYVQAVAGCMTAVFLANRSAARQIRKFDMVEVLKERE